jgi:hypothetical protein
LREGIQKFNVNADVMQESLVNAGDIVEDASVNDPKTDL